MEETRGFQEKGHRSPAANNAEKQVRERRELRKELGGGNPPHWGTAAVAQYEEKPDYNPLRSLGCAEAEATAQTTSSKRLALRARALEGGGVMEKDLVQERFLRFYKCSEKDLGKNEGLRTYY